MNIQEKGDIGSESRPVRVSSRLEEALWVWGKSWETVANAEEVKRSGLEWGGRLIPGLCLFLCVKWGLGGKLFNTEVVNCVLYNPSGCCNMTVCPKRAKKKNLGKRNGIQFLSWRLTVNMIPECSVCDILGTHVDSVEKVSDCHYWQGIFTHEIFIRYLLEVRNRRESEIDKILIWLLCMEMEPDSFVSEGKIQGITSIESVVLSISYLDDKVSSLL